MMSASWYIKTSDAAEGPVSFEELRKRARTDRLATTDRVREGLSGAWRFADSVRGLFEHVSGRKSETRAETNADPRAIVEGPQLWHYRLGDSEHGPVPRAELLDLLAHSAVIARDVLVRRHDEEAWVPFASRFAAEIPELAFSAVADAPDVESRTRQAGSAAEIPSQREKPRQALPKTPLRARFRAMVPVVAGLAVLLSVGILYGFWPDPYATERRYFAKLQDILDQVHALREADTSRAEWIQFRAQSSQAITAIVKDLKKTAGPSKPLRQQLLWVARDEMPRILGPRTTESAGHEDQVDLRLGIVRKAINRR